LGAEEKLANMMPDAVPQAIPTAAPVLVQPASAVGLAVKHLWTEDGEDVWYGGRVHKMKKNLRFQICRRRTPLIMI
jgi:hypothetical protein